MKNNKRLWASFLKSQDDVGVHVGGQLYATYIATPISRECDRVSAIVFICLVVHSSTRARDQNR